MLEGQIMVGQMLFEQKMVEQFLFAQKLFGTLSCQTKNDRTNIGRTKGVLNVKLSNKK
jgi:hypothetical protein